MYKLTNKEIDQVVSQNVIPHKKYFGGATPYAFTEAGVAMLSSVLKSERAVEMNIAIMRTFVVLRKMGLNYEEIMKKLKKMESEYDGKFKRIYDALNYLLNPTNKSYKALAE
jgi:hypothetical protein